ncbi:MAG: hypothetical protein WCY24_06680 [Lutispora sp.]
MYKVFRQNIDNFFFLNRHGSSEKEFRLKIAQVLKGLAYKDIYEQWAVENKEMYEEVNNLVYEIQQNKDRFHSFDAFSWDLWGLDYKAEKNNRFSKDIVGEQLKLINLLLGTQYWIEPK